MSETSIVRHWDNLHGNHDGNNTADTDNYPTADEVLHKLNTNCSLCHYIGLRGTNYISRKDHDSTYPGANDRTVDTGNFEQSWADHRIKHTPFEPNCLICTESPQKNVAHNC